MQLFLARIKDSFFHLHESEVVHCTKVLRKSAGDTIHFITGEGPLYQGVITEVGKKEVYGTFTVVDPHFGHLPYDLSVVIAPTKNTDRFEWFLEKAVELGVSKIYPVLCQRSERKHLRLDRMEKVVLSAAKQSLKGRLPEIAPLRTLEETLSHARGTLAVAHLEDGDRTSWRTFLREHAKEPLVLFIGPEGDFTPEEIALLQKAGARAVHLGSSRLRTETAGVAGVAAVYFEFN